MIRRDFCLGAMAIAIDPVPIAIAKKKKLKYAVVWDAHDVEAVKINLIYDDRSSTVTTIPKTWFYEHPIELVLLRDGFSGSPAYHPQNPVWTTLCEGIVEEYIHGK